MLFLGMYQPIISTAMGYLAYEPVKCLGLCVDEEDARRQMRQHWLRTYPEKARVLELADDQYGGSLLTSDARTVDDLRRMMPNSFRDVVEAWLEGVADLRPPDNTREGS